MKTKQANSISWPKAQSTSRRITSRRGRINWRISNQEGYSEKKDDETKRISRRIIRRTQAKEENSDRNENRDRDENGNKNRNRDRNKDRNGNNRNNRNNNNHNNQNKEEGQNQEEAGRREIIKLISEFHR